MRALPLLLLAQVAAVLPGQASLLRDIVPGTQSSLPAGFVDVRGSVFFSAGDNTHGHALWKTDGTPAGTVLVKDFYPGPGGGVQPRELTDLDGLLVCYADDGVHGAELWRSDGTPQGTWMIRDINPGNQGRPVYMDPPVNLTVWQGRLYFSARDGRNGREPWVTDGTPTGTRLLADIHAGGNTSDSLPSHFTPARDQLFFFAFEPATGWELWRTDGTAAGTRLVKDVWPGPEPSLITHNSFPFATLARRDGTLLFAAPDAQHGYELWRSDGTAAGTVLVKDLVPGAGHSYFNRNFCEAGPFVYFTATDGVHGRELWRTDGTPGGTVMVKDIHVGTADSTPGWMVAFGSRVLFDADDGTRGREMWISDGTAAGTVLFREFRPGPAGGLRPNLFSHLRMVGTRFAYFTADDGVRGDELWRTDGTAAGTTLVADVWPGPGGSYPEFFTLSRGRLVFRARHGAYGQEPFVLFPGATAQVLGRGWSPGGTAPTLRVADPVLGTTVPLAGEVSAVGSPVTISLGLPAARPVTWPGGPSLHLDPLAPILPVLSFNPTTKDWTGGAAMPNDPGLIGQPFAVQAYQLRSGPGIGFETTNGVVLTGGR